MSQHPTDGNKWRHPKERAELVERLIRADSEVKLLRATMRDLMTHAEVEPSLASYVTALQARNTQLEQNLERVVAENERLNRKAA